MLVIFSLVRKIIKLNILNFYNFNFLENNNNTRFMSFGKGESIVLKISRNDIVRTIF